MKDLYEDIINLPHHVSKTRPQMSMIDRAAQFSPFAALTGYDAAIKETGRLTDEPDERKAGGAYIDVTGKVKKVDDFERLIVMQNGTKMPMDDILNIEGEIFASL